MKIVHIPFCFAPDPVGGTEVYVDALAREQQARGLDVLVAAPGEKTLRYSERGLRVRRFATSSRLRDLRDLYGEGDTQACREFAGILDDEAPDIIHLHAFTSGVSVRVMREAQRRGIPVVFTYHTPTVSCVRGTLLRWGTVVCDGTLDLHACARCSLHGLGAGQPASALLGGLHPNVGKLIGMLGRSGGPWTALRMTELVELRHAAFRTLMREVDQTVVVCNWAAELLVRNGVPAHKITLSRHGLPRTWSNSAGPVHPPSTTGRLRIAFLGRFDATKGPDLLVRALRGLPDAPLEVHLYGVDQSAAARAYRVQVERLAGGDRRAKFYPPVPNERVIPLLHEYDLVAVPSRWLETGPLVVLEAFAAGVPVLGSDLGGIAELVEHGVNGLLVPADSLESWQRVLQRFFDEPALLERLRAGVQQPRRMDVVAREMHALYSAALGPDRRGLVPLAVAEVLDASISLKEST